MSADEPIELPVMNSPQSCRAALRWGLHTAMARRARQITCVAPGFEHWPFDDEALLQAWGQWLRLPQRQCRCLAAGYEGLATLLPRFDRWRRDWTHALSFWVCPPELIETLPTGLFDDARLSVRILDTEQGTGRASLERRTHLQLLHQTDAILQRSERAWPVKTLGL